MEISPATSKRLHALLNKTGLMEHKASLVYSFSDGRTESSKEMTFQEGIRLVKYLENLTPLPPLDYASRLERGNDKQADDKEKCNKLRRVIISKFYELHNARTKEQKADALKACFNWVEKHFKAHLNSFDAQTLFKIKLAAENMIKDRAKAVRKGVMSCE